MRDTQDRNQWNNAWNSCLTRVLPAKTSPDACWLDDGSTPTRPLLSEAIARLARVDPNQVLVAVTGLVCSLIGAGVAFGAQELNWRRARRTQAADEQSASVHRVERRRNRAQRRHTRREPGRRPGADQSGVAAVPEHGGAGRHCRWRSRRRGASCRCLARGGSWRSRLVGHLGGRFVSSSRHLVISPWEAHRAHRAHRVRLVVSRPAADGQSGSGPVCWVCQQQPWE